MISISHYLTLLLFFSPLSQWNQKLMDKHVATETYLGVYRAICANEQDKAIELLKSDPTLLLNTETRSILTVDACHRGADEVLDFLIEKGASANFVDRKSSVLSTSIANGHLKVIKTLLNHHADPNLTRAFVTAVSGTEVGKHRLEIVELMIQHGVDVNKVYAMFGDKKRARTALDFTSPGTPVRELLLKNGAKTAAQVLAENPNVEIED